MDIRESVPKQTSASSSTDLLSTPSRPAEPFFIVPPGFRQNPFFIGMRRELALINQRLFDHRRNIGTASVLVHGQPGSGKSHLVRQYVYENRNRFPGGIFWINAHLLGEVENDFGLIIQKVVSKVSPEIILSNKAGNNADTIREWFQSRQEWLIVLDGITSEKDSDIDKLQAFIPDSPNSSIVYVSRSSRFETVDRLLNPSAIKVRPLKEAEGRDLLFKELRIENPRPAQIKSATDLIHKIGGLPLAINAIARRIADTHVPIEKYSMRSYSVDPVLGGTYKVIMDDLRKNRHSEALNLLSIICFFGPLVPVEMIHLGAQALKGAALEIRSSENGEDPDLNTTFGILMRHALIERNEPDDNSSISSSRDSLVEPEPIDTLKMHTVVQKFAVDSLHSSKKLTTWLDHAVQLFIYSYREADTRIRSRPEPARVSDYRQYSLHGEQLHLHATTYDSRRHSLKTIRGRLDKVLDEIATMIRAMEPRSSQDSIVQAEFQCSIFDRTNITSSSDASQIDDKSPQRSSPSTPSDEKKLLTVTLRSGSVSSAERSLPTIAIAPSVEGRRSSYPDPQVNDGAAVLSSHFMEKRLSSASTIRPIMARKVDKGGLNSFNAPTTMTGVSTEEAIGSIYTGPTLDAEPGPEGHSNAFDSLTNLQKIKEQLWNGYSSFWRKEFPSGAASRASEQLKARTNTYEHDKPMQTSIPNRMAPTPTSVASQPPKPLMVSGRDNVENHHNLLSSNLQGHPGFTSYDLPVNLSLEPLAHALHGKDDDDSLLKENLTSDTAPRRPYEFSQTALTTDLPPGHSPLTDSTIPAPHLTRGPWTSQQAQTSRELQKDGAQQYQRPLLQHLPGPRALVSSTSDLNLQQYALNNAYQAYAHTIEHPPPVMQSTQNQVRPSETSPRKGSPRLRSTDQSPPQKSTHFSSANSSPAVPPHMFSSIHSDVAPLGDPQHTFFYHPDLSMLAVHEGQWIEVSAKDPQATVQSAPLVHAPFSPALALPPSSAISALHSPLGLGVFPSEPGIEGQGVGIGELGNAPYLQSINGTPLSDPRRRLRERKDRLRQRDASILVRLPSELDHPLAPKNKDNEVEKRRSMPNIVQFARPEDQIAFVDSSAARATWQPVDWNVGRRSSAPYPEINRIPTRTDRLAVFDSDLRLRRRSMPESPGSVGTVDSAGWLGQ